MDKRLILAVAGSGKTTLIINKLDLIRKFLIVTYTDNNVNHIRTSIINKFGYFPSNIVLLSYFQFLIRTCYRPFLKDKYRDHGITWKMPNEYTLRLRRDDMRFYMTSNKLLYHNRIAKLCFDNCADSISQRIDKYYDCFLFDEIQDLGGHDFNLILSIIPKNTDCIFVGDFYQHTFDTSRDGTINSGLYKNEKSYKVLWKNKGLLIDGSTLSKSHRCSPTVCDFVTSNLGITIGSHRSDITSIVFIDTQEQADTYFADSEKIKLFFTESYKYNCYNCNWGKSKGQNKYIDVCIVLNKKTLKAYKDNKLSELPPSTLNKLYVACTRARGNIYFIPHIFFDKYKNE